MRLTRKHLRRLIRESIEQHHTWPGDEDPRPTPLEPEFVNSADQLAGYIVVYDSYDHTLVAHAPITRTDGPDRPFLVRTSDTRWHVPFWMVRLIYPAVQDAFNAVDSKEDWRGMGPGDRGEVGEFEWEWAEAEPEEELLSESTSEPLTGQIVSAGKGYIKSHEIPMQRTQAVLVEMLKVPGSDGHIALIDLALNKVREEHESNPDLSPLDPLTEGLIKSALKNIPLEFLLKAKALK